MKSIKLHLPVLAALLTLAACGGGGGGGGSTSGGSGGGGTTLALAYVSPTGYASQATQCALVLDAASTSSNLILDVIGPKGFGAVGLTFAFDVDTTKATWSTSPVVTNGNVFTLGTGTQLCQGWVTGKRLQGIVASKGLGNQVSDAGTGIVAKISLTPVKGATAGTVTLTDAGLGNLMDNNGPPALPVHFSVGTLTLQ